MNKYDEGIFCCVCLNVTRYMLAKYYDRWLRTSFPYNDSITMIQIASFFFTMIAVTSFVYNNNNYIVIKSFVYNDR